MGDTTPQGVQLDQPPFVVGEAGIRSPHLEREPVSNEQSRDEMATSVLRRRGMLVGALSIVLAVASLVLFAPVDRAALLVQLLSSAAAVAVAVVPLCRRRSREE